MSAPTLQAEWDALTPDQQAQHRGNLDPWAGPVDPAAYARWLRTHQSSQRTWQAKREQQADACGCWANDCAECGPRRADGERPAKGAVRRRALRVDAGLQQAKERWHAAQQAVS